MKCAGIFAEGRFLRDESNYPAGKDNANDAALQAGVTSKFLRSLIDLSAHFLTFARKRSQASIISMMCGFRTIWRRMPTFPSSCRPNAIVIKNGLKSPCSGISTVASRRGKNPRSVSFAVGGPDGQRNTQHSDGENTVLAGAIRLRSVRLSAPDSVAR